MGKLRLFVAIETPHAVRAKLADVITTLRATNADVRWEQTEKLHITLKFLGDTDERKLESIIASLEQIAQSFPEFSIRYASLGCFPHQREPRIIWAGVGEADATLAHLARSIDDALAALGFRKEERAFHAHVTLGRVKSQRNVHHLLRTMESITFESQPEHVAHFVLVKSELKQSGSVYTTLHHMRLQSHRNSQSNNPQ